MSIMAIFLGVVNRGFRKSDIFVNLCLNLEEVISCLQVTLVF